MMCFFNHVFAQHPPNSAPCAKLDWSQGLSEHPGRLRSLLDLHPMVYPVPILWHQIPPGCGTTRSSRISSNLNFSVSKANRAAWRLDVKFGEPWNWGKHLHYMCRMMSDERLLGQKRLLFCHRYWLSIHFEWQGWAKVQRRPRQQTKA